MPLFRKQPVVIEAHQVPPEGEECDAAMTIFLSGADPDSMESVGDGSIEIHTPEGSMVASPGDWIIKGVKGEYYPCKPDIFDQTYAPAEVVDGNVVALPTRDKPPIDEGMVNTLKGLLVRAENGEIESFVMAIKESDGGLNFATATRPWDAITLAALLHDEMLRLMRTHGMALRT